jgi:hypothetical protein
MAAAARVTRSGEGAVGTELDRRDAAEEEVPVRPADDLPAGQRLVGSASLEVEKFTVDVDPRGVDRLLERDPP